MIQSLYSGLFYHLSLAMNGGWKFKLGQRVAKKSGSSWHGRVVGFYTTGLTARLLR